MSTPASANGVSSSCSRVGSSAIFAAVELHGAQLPTGPIPLGANEFTYRRIRRIADRTDPLPSRGDRCGAPAQSVRTIRSSSASRSGRAPTTLNATVTVAEFVPDTWESRVCTGRLKLRISVCAGIADGSHLPGLVSAVWGARRALVGCCGSEPRLTGRRIRRWAEPCVRPVVAGMRQSVCG